MQKVKNLKHIGLQYFAEPTLPAPADPPAADPSPLNFEEMIKTDKAFQSWLDGRVTAATNTAVTKAQEKWKKAQDTSLSEAERLKTMTADEKAEYYRKKYEDETAARQRSENAAALRGQAAGMFTEAAIPPELLDTIDFETATAEAVKARVELLKKFEFYPKGTFEQKLNEKLNEKLRQKPPETHNGGGDPLAWKPNGASGAKPWNKFKR